MIGFNNYPLPYAKIDGVTQSYLFFNQAFGSLTDFVKANVLFKVVAYFNTENNALTQYFLTDGYLWANYKNNNATEAWAIRSIDNWVTDTLSLVVTDGVVLASDYKIQGQAHFDSIIRAKMLSQPDVLSNLQLNILFSEPLYTEIAQLITNSSSRIRLQTVIINDLLGKPISIDLSAQLLLPNLHLLTVRFSDSQYKQAVNKQINQFFDSTHIGFIALDGGFKIQRFNRAASQRFFTVFGQSLLEGDSIFTYTINRYRLQVERDLLEAFEGRNVQTEYAFLVGTRWVWFELQFSPIYIENRNEINGVLVAIYDISEIKSSNYIANNANQLLDSLYQNWQLPAVKITDGDNYIEQPNIAFSDHFNYEGNWALQSIGLANPKMWDSSQFQLGKSIFFHAKNAENNQMAYSAVAYSISKQNQNFFYVFISPQNINVGRKAEIGSEIAQIHLSFSKDGDLINANLPAIEFIEKALLIFPFTQITLNNLLSVFAIDIRNIDLPERPSRPNGYFLYSTTDNENKRFALYLVRNNNNMVTDALIVLADVQKNYKNSLREDAASYRREQISHNNRLASQQYNALLQVIDKLGISLVSKTEGRVWTFGQNPEKEIESGLIIARLTHLAQEMVASNTVGSFKLAELGLPGLKAVLLIENNNWFAVVLKPNSPLLEIIDLLDVRQTKAELQNARLQSINHDLEAFNYTLTHDIRTPLRAINGFANALKIDYANQLDDNAKMICDRLASNGIKLDNLVQTLLKLSQLSRTPPQFTRFDIKNLIENSISNFHSPEMLCPIKYSNELNVEVVADVNMLSVVFDNLIGNSIKYASPIRELYLRFFEPTVNQIPNDYRNEIMPYLLSGNYKVFCISDNGIGFENKFARKIFGAFQRIDTQNYEGQGIGLATVKRILTIHKSDIWAFGQPNVGANFYLCVPCTVKVFE